MALKKILRVLFFYTGCTVFYLSNKIYALSFDFIAFSGVEFALFNLISLFIGVTLLLISIRDLYSLVSFIRFKRWNPNRPTVVLLLFDDVKFWGISFLCLIKIASYLILCLTLEYSRIVSSSTSVSNIIGFIGVMWRSLESIKGIWSGSKFNGISWWSWLMKTEVSMDDSNLFMLFLVLSLRI